MLLVWVFVCAPVSFSSQEGGDFLPRDENGKVLFSEVDYLDTWRVSYPFIMAEADPSSFVVKRNY